MSLEDRIEALVQLCTSRRQLERLLVLHMFPGRFVYDVRSWYRIVEESEQLGVPVPDECRIAHFVTEDERPNHQRRVAA